MHEVLINSLVKLSQEKVWLVEHDNSCLLRRKELKKKKKKKKHHNAAFHQGLHCLLRSKQSSGTEIHHDLENST